MRAWAFACEHARTSQEAQQGSVGAERVVGADPPAQPSKEPEPESEEGRPAEEGRSVPPSKFKNPLQRVDLD